MHLIIGILLIVGTFSVSLQYMGRQFDGFWNLYAAVLLGGVPLGVAIATYRFSTLATTVRALARAVSRRPEQERDSRLQGLLTFAREVRKERGAAAAAVLEQSRDPFFIHLGHHVLQSSETTELETDALLLGRRELEPYRSGERVLATLGNIAPAMGMIGTVIGLIRLLVHMQSFDELGSGMAIALLTTFYGLILGHVIYLPLSRLVGNYGRQRADTLNLVIDGLLKLSRRRPLHEVQDALGANAAGEHNAGESRVPA